MRAAEARAGKLGPPPAPAVARASSFGQVQAMFTKD
jgi:hypothetical protein